jgi:hypothetical protein
MVFQRRSTAAPLTQGVNIEIGVNRFAADEMLELAGRLQERCGKA